MDPVRILRECVAESGGNLEAAVEAADYILAVLDIADNIRLSVNDGAKDKPWVNEYGITIDGNGAALSLDSNECRDETWTDEWGITHSSSVPLSLEEQRQRNDERRKRELDRKRADRKRQFSILATLDQASAEMQPTMDAALAILDQ